MTYDRLGRLKSEANPAQDAAEKPYRYTYDDNGNLTETTDPQDRVITRTYNTANLPVTVAVSGDPDAGIAYYYDPNLNLERAENNTEAYSISMTYDDSNRLGSLTPDAGEFPELSGTQEYSWRPDGRLSSYTLPGGRQATSTPTS